MSVFRRGGAGGVPWAWLLGSSLAIWACDGDRASSKAHHDTGPTRDVDSGTAADAAAPMVLRKLIRAHEGGAMKFGPLTLIIPGGALAKDTEVTIELDAPDVPAPDGALTAVYRIGPAEAAFTQYSAAQLSIGLSNARTEAITVAAFDPVLLGGAQHAWFDLRSEATADGGLATNINHFSSFSVRGLQCPEPFEACGGDLTGEWHLAHGCHERPFPACDALSDVGGSASIADGRVTFFKGGAVDAYFYQVISAHFTVPLACAGGCNATNLGCQTVGADACNCSLTSALDRLGAYDGSDPWTSCARYESSGNEVTFHCSIFDMGTSPTDITMKYCVKNGELRFASSSAYQGLFPGYFTFVRAAPSAGK